MFAAGTQGTLESLGIVAISLTSILIFIRMLLKTSASVSSYFGSKLERLFAATVGIAVKNELNYRNDGSGHGDKIDRIIANQEEFKENSETMQSNISLICNKLKNHLEEDHGVTG